MTTRKTDLQHTNAKEETQSSDSHVTKPSKKQLSDVAVPGPIYFLIREQAKSLVAIKELKERVRSLEGVQDDVFQAVNGLQFQMDRSLQLVSCYPDMMKANLYASSKSDDGSVAKSSSSTSHPGVQSRSRSNVPASTAATDETKKEHIESSDSKQDSGLDSDCQAHQASLPTAKKGVGEGDELLDLLDVIAQKGSGLWKRVEECERLRTLEEEEAKETLSNQDVAGLLQACRSLQRRLRVANQEKGNLRSQMMYIERVAHEMKAENELLEERLEAVLRDKQKLESQIHRLHSQFVSSKEARAEGDQKPKKLGRVRNSEESRNRVAAILKESNVLELQRQLLMYIMENEVLNTKMEQLEHMRISAARESEKNESRLQCEVQQLLKERNELLAAVEESRMEMTAVQAKSRMLERALHAVSQDPGELDGSLDAQSGASIRSQPSLGSNLQRRQRHSLLSNSLPPVLMSGGGEHYVEEVHPIQDASGYLNITGNDSADRYGAFPILTNLDDGYRWSSTPIRSRFQTPSFGKLSVPRESSINSRGTKSSETFPREFDQFSATHNRRGKVSEYIDSLDTTPTKVFGPAVGNRESPNTIRVPMAHIRNPLIRQTPSLRYSDVTKRRSDSYIQTLLPQVDEALL